jgi:hypothetical protein
MKCNVKDSDNVHVCNIKKGTYNLYCLEKDTLYSIFERIPQIKAFRFEDCERKLYLVEDTEFDVEKGERGNRTANVDFVIVDIISIPLGWRVTKKELDECKEMFDKPHLKYMGKGLFQSIWERYG